MFLVQQLLYLRMIPINPIRPRHHRQQIIRHTMPLLNLTRQRPTKQRHPLPRL